MTGFRGRLGTALLVFVSLATAILGAIHRHTANESCPACLIARIGARSTKTPNDASVAGGRPVLPVQPGRRLALRVTVDESRPVVDEKPCPRTCRGARDAPQGVSLGGGERAPPFCA